MAHTRAEVGVGDCAYVIGFSTALVLSRLAREVLEQSIGQLGQFIPVTVESERWYIFNCTRVINALTDSTDVRLVGNGRPSQLKEPSFRKSVLATEMIFKTSWPSHVSNSSQCNPPMPLFATHEFVDLVRKSGLTGFRFSELPTA